MNNWEQEQGGFGKASALTWDIEKIQKEGREAGKSKEQIEAEIEAFKKRMTEASTRLREANERG